MAAASVSVAKDRLSSFRSRLFARLTRARRELRRRWAKKRFVFSMQKIEHGSVEIPAILIGGQAGFVLANALLGRGERRSLAVRFKGIIPDVMTLSLGASLMLVWAGIVEAFFSQYHEPVLPYSIKIAFGVSELVALVWYYSRSGHRLKERANG